MTQLSRCRRFPWARLFGWMLALGAASGRMALAQESPPDSPKALDGPPALPPVTLIRIAHQEELVHRRDTLAAIEELLQRAQGAADAPTRLQQNLEAAQRLLADVLEPPVTTRFLELPADLGMEESRLTTHLDRVDGILRDAASTLDEKDPGLSDDIAAPLRRRLKTLEAFTGAFRAFLLPASSDARHQAALRLSPVLEDDDPVVAEAAGFWQALLRLESADPAAALLVLPHAFTELDRRHLPWDFFARLQRCRAIAATGGFPTAVTLLMQIEDRCGQWLPPGGPDRAAERAALWLQMVILRKWWDASPPDSSQREWCARRIREIAEEHFTADAPVLRLHPAIPRLDAESQAPRDQG